jgi:ubiquinone/menaquinone biosynthesis C-methylase UbiE
MPRDDLPAFRKPDRYKASSYRAYNLKQPERYDASFWMRFCQTGAWDRAVIDVLGPGRLGELSILDVGCATGRLLCALGDAGAGRLAGADLAPRILEVAREKLAARGLPADLRVADAEDRLPWSDDAFDVVTLTGVLHHFYRPADALREMARVLRPGGLAVLVDPGFFPPLRQLLNLALRIAPHEGDCHFHSMDGARKLLERTGLRCTGARRVGLWAWLLSAAAGSPSPAPAGA